MCRTGRRSPRPVRLTACASYDHHPGVSKPLRYDALLARALAAELHQRWAGARVRWVRLEPETRTIHIAIGRGALRWSLDPQNGTLVQATHRGPASGVNLPAGARLRAVTSPPDDRRIDFFIDALPDGSRSFSLSVDLTARRNAVLATDGRVLAALLAARTTTIDTQDAQPRAGLAAPLDAAAFAALLLDVPPAQRERAFLERVAWASPLNARAILGTALEGDDEMLLLEAWTRYARVIDPQSTQAGIVAPGDWDQPYPSPLPGLPFEPHADLLAAFAAATPERPETDADLLGRLAQRQKALGRRAGRLRAEMEGGASDAAQARQKADVLLARLASVRRGMRSVTLEDFEGGTLTIELNPALDPAANANMLYERARKRDRAAARVPALLAGVAAEAQRLAALETRMREGSATEADRAALRRAPDRSVSGRPARVLPYRRYRTSGGLEVRVGRSARANDDLTLHHSAPGDILAARPRGRGCARRAALAGRGIESTGNGPGGSRHAGRAAQPGAHVGHRARRLDAPPLCAQTAQGQARHGHHGAREHAVRGAGCAPRGASARSGLNNGEEATRHRRLQSVNVRKPVTGREPRPWRRAVRRENARPREHRRGRAHQ